MTNAIPGLPIALYEAGSGGPPFVFIHGLACDHTFWQPQVDDLKRDYRCLSVDLRGRGAASPAGPYDTTQQADDVAAAMRALGVGPAIIVGHSLGGLAALLLNDRHPDLVLGIVAGDSPYRNHTPGGFDAFAASIAAAGTVAGIGARVESFFVESTSGAIKQHVRDVMLSCPAEVVSGMLSNAAVFGERMVELVKQADQKPFMVIWAEKPSGDPAWLREVTMFTRQEPMPGAGHFFQLERPAVTNALLRAFVDDVQRDPRIAALRGS